MWTLIYLSCGKAKHDFIHPFSRQGFSQHLYSLKEKSKIERKKTWSPKTVLPTISASPRLQLRDLGPCSLLEMWAHWDWRDRNELFTAALPDCGSGQGHICEGPWNKHRLVLCLIDSLLSTTHADLELQTTMHQQGFISNGFPSSVWSQSNFCIFSVSLIDFASNSVNCTFAIWSFFFLLYNLKLMLHLSFNKLFKIRLVGVILLLLLGKV